MRSAAEQAYYDAACLRLSELAGWFFSGESPWQDGAPPFEA